MNLSKISNGNRVFAPNSVKSKLNPQWHEIICYGMKQISEHFKYTPSELTANPPKHTYDRFETTGNSDLSNQTKPLSQLEMDSLMTAQDYMNKFLFAATAATSQKEMDDMILKINKAKGTKVLDIIKERDKFVASLIELTKLLIKNGVGNCDALVFLLAYYAVENGIPADQVFIIDLAPSSSSSLFSCCRKVDHDGHAMLKVGTTYYDPLTGESYTHDQLYPSGNKNGISITYLPGSYDEKRERPLSDNLDANPLIKHLQFNKSITEALNKKFN